MSEVKIHPSRRDALKCGAALLSGAALTQVSPTVQAMQLNQLAIDAHSHVWTPDVTRFPLAAGYTAEQMEPRSFTADELLAQARPNGVGRVVLIQMSYYGFDNRYMLDAIRSSPGVFSGVAVIDENATGLRDTMHGLRQQGVRGFRIHPAQKPVDTWLASSGMAEMWRVGAEQKLAMCALVNPNALEPLDAMCTKFPDTPVVIDHFARIGMDGTIRQEQVDQLCRLARHRNTHVKVSAFYALGKKRAPYDDLAPMIRRLYDAYTPQRLMWGTDCPYQVEQGHTYRDSIELVRSNLQFLSVEDRRWLLGRTAERVFFS